MRNFQFRNPDGDTCVQAGRTPLQLAELNGTDKSGVGQMLRVRACGRPHAPCTHTQYDVTVRHNPPAQLRAGAPSAGAGKMPAPMNRAQSERVVSHGAARMKASSGVVAAGAGGGEGPKRAVPTRAPPLVAVAEAAPRAGPPARPAMAPRMQTEKHLKVCVAEAGCACLWLHSYVLRSHFSLACTFLVACVCARTCVSVFKCAPLVTCGARLQGAGHR
jgi:hypothetical protein